MWSSVSVEQYLCHAALISPGFESSEDNFVSLLFLLQKSQLLMLAAGAGTGGWNGWNGV